MMNCKHSALVKAAISEGIFLSDIWFDWDIRTLSPKDFDTKLANIISTFGEEYSARNKDGVWAVTQEAHSRIVFRVLRVTARDLVTLMTIKLMV